MVQPDEAMSDYKSLIFMLDGSLQFIKDNFGVIPKVAMAIDAFGHSSLSPYLYSSLGYEAMILYRMPVEIQGYFGDNHKMWFTWEGDAESRIKAYRVWTYALDYRFNINNGGGCFQNSDMCASQFLDLMVDPQTQDNNLKKGHKIAY